MWKSIQTSSKLKRIIIYTLAVISAVIVGFPFYWMLNTAFKDPTQLGNAKFIPTPPTFKNWIELFEVTDFLIYLTNSTLVAIGATVITLFLSILTGYSLTRFRFKGSTMLPRLTLFTYMFPPILLAIPLYLIYRRIGLVDTLPGLMIAHSAFCLPFALFLIWQFFSAVPKSLEESALIDGATRLEALFFVVIPVSAPGIAAAGIFTFAVSWSDYTFALILINSTMKKTISIGVTTFIERAAVHWGLTQTASVLACIPAFILIAFAQKWIIQGFAASGIKG